MRVPAFHRGIYAMQLGAIKTLPTLPVHFKHFKIEWRVLEMAVAPCVPRIGADAD